MMSQPHLSLTDDAATHLTQLLIDLASMPGINPDYQYEAAYCSDQVREQLPAIEALVIAGLLREAPERLALDPGTRAACRWWSRELIHALADNSATL
jgi:hypothetical protein